MTLPTFLVAGGARCGTTGLVEGLRRHPRIFVTDPKEPHYFALHRIGASFTAPGDAHTINRVAVTDRAQYLALYEEAGQAEPPFLALGEGSVSTMYYYEESLPEVLSVNPDMKLVVLLREPVDRRSAPSATCVLGASNRSPTSSTRWLRKRSVARGAGTTSGTTRA